MSASQLRRLRLRERAEGHPIRVGLVGCGQMGRGLAAQLGRMDGLELTAAVDVELENAQRALRLAGRDESTDDGSAAASVAAGAPVALRSAEALGQLDLDAVVEATGVPHVGAEVAMRCLLAGIHVVSLNVEADVTVGAYLDRVAASSGVVYTVADGDEPVAAKGLVDFAEELAFDVVCAGKGKNNPFRPTATPEDVTDEAARRGMNPRMLASFVDGSKTMIEMTALANATGLVPDVVGMHGPEATVDELTSAFRTVDDGGLLSAPGRVDYAFGPAPGVFVVVRSEDEVVVDEMAYLSMGDGPYWALYRPYHLASLEAPRSVVTAVLDGRPSLRPSTWTAEVVTVAKRDLQPGDELDGIGGHSVRGVIYPADDAAELLPLGLAGGATVTGKIAAGDPVARAEVELPDSSLRSMRQLQEELIPSGGAPGAAE